MSDTKPPIEQAVAAMPCFWPRCSDHKRCQAHGSCVAKAQAGGSSFRASTGKIRDAAQWATDWEQRNYQKMAEWEGGGVATFVGFLQAVQADALAAAQPEPRWNDKVAKIYSPKACRTCQSPFREGCVCTFCGDQSPHCEPIPKPTEKTKNV